MITKRFEVSLFHAHYDDDNEIRLVARVVTDHTHHTATQTFNKEGKPGIVWAESGRTYTPDQDAAVKQLLAYYHPIVMERVTKWMTEHNFDNSKHRLAVELDGNIHIYNARYNGDKS
jgi:hypothetical protein